MGRLYSPSPVSVMAATAIWQTVPSLSPRTRELLVSDPESATKSRAPK